MTHRKASKAHSLKLRVDAGQENALNWAKHRNYFELDEGIYVSGVETAKNEVFFNDKRITHVVNCVSDNFPNYFQTQTVSYLSLNMRDTLDQNLIPDVEQTLTFIERASSEASSQNEKPRVLIHCHRGLSRSVALGVAYLMRHKEMTLEQALDHCQGLNPEICPNVGFVYQLKQWSETLENQPTIQQGFLANIDY